MPTPADPSAKKPYESPKLLVYGDLTELTHAKGIHKMGDGGMKGIKRKTAP